jgi:hypothetical protein
MSEDLKAVLSGNGHQSHAGSIRHAYCQCSGVPKRRRLHHLDRNTARQHDHALPRRYTFLCKRAGKLVQRIVAANILAHGNQATRRVPEARGGVHRTGLLIQYLQRVERLDHS